MTAPCTQLAWDSDFFGIEIARLRAPTLDEAALDEVRVWARKTGVRCVYCLLQADDGESIRVAERGGLRLVDIRVTLERSLAGVSPGLAPGLRNASAEDVALLREIARVSHRDARFHYDPGFPDERCDELYATWIENSCQGFAAGVLVADDGAGAQGYISCHLDGAEGSIGLIAVSDAARGRGAGRRLVDGSLAWFAQRNLERAVVVTQGRNVGALRMYERSGFLARSVELWYHLWPSDDRSQEPLR